MLVLSTLTAAPAGAQDAPDGIFEASQSEVADEPPPPPQQLTDEQRLPVLDLDDVEGLRPEDVVQIVPGETGPPSPSDAVDQAPTLPSEGSSNVDAFGFGPDRANHIALVYPDEVNELRANGTWRDIVIGLTRTADGWEWTDAAGITTSFPQKLSAETPVRFSAPEGTLSMAPADSASAAVESGEGLVYAGAFADGDLRYTPVRDGVQEEIVLAGQPSSSSFPFTITTKGLTLSANAYGGIDVLAGAERVGRLPAPVAYDASPEPASSTGTYKLSETASGSYVLEIAIDPGFLAGAKYPVVIDPTWDDASSRDGYTNASSPGTEYESSSLLQVNQGKRIYLDFQTGSLHVDERIVYDARLFLYPTGSGGVSGGIDAKRVSDPWPTPAGTLNWNNQPAVGGVQDTVSTAGGNGWWSWNVTDLYQRYLDPTDIWNPHWADRGVALAASNPKTFYAVEDTSVPGSEPVLYVTFNDLPNRPTTESPPPGYVTETESLTLKVEGGPDWPSDRNGDEVLVSFQISDDGVSWTGSHLIYQSPYDDSRSFTVPAGILHDGQTYFWRAVSLDVCDPQTQAVCSLRDGSGTLREPNGTNPRSFTVALKHLGHDDRWAMWSSDVGNGMSLEVNQANGNLFLDVPLDAYATPIGPLELSLSYNSQQDDDFGLSAGWDVAIGPRSSLTGLPLELVKLDSGPDADVKIRFRGGTTRYFPHLDGKLWGATSAMSGYVTQAKDNTWTYFDAEGGTFVFDAGALNGSPLKRAKPAVSANEATDKAFTYAYNGSLQLQSVTDPLDRVVTLGWTADRLTLITATGFGGQVFTLGYDGGRLDHVSTTVNNPTTQTNTEERLDFDYVADGDGDGLLSWVKDGVQAAADGDGWAITYVVPPDDPSPNPVVRVSTITAPGSGDPATAGPPTPWTFRYIGDYTGTTAWGTCVTDPRGDPTSSTCDTTTTDDGPYETLTRFSVAGLPIEVIGPHDPGGQFRPITTYVFDNHNNLICERSPEANALGGLSCTTAMVDGEYTDLDDGGMSTVYSYGNKAPYRLKTITRPSASPTSAYPRLLESYTYDGGTTFEGMWVEMYGNEDLSGLPATEVLWTDLNRDWGNGSPAGVPGGDETWGLRMSGLIDISDLGGSKRYEFRVFSDDGVRLTVEGVTILDCFGQAHDDESEANCGQGDVSKVLWGSDAPIQVEYSDITGDAALNIKWDKGNGTWQTIPGSRITPDLGLVTSKTYQRVDSGSSTVDLWQERWTYPTVDLKSRRLHEDHVREDLETGVQYTTRYTYDTTYGRVLTETANAQDPAIDATTTYAYTDGASPQEWGLGGAEVSCLTRAVDALGATTDYRCNLAGDTTSETLTIQPVAGTDQGQQTRTTSTEYDSLGRVTETLQQEAGSQTITAYDAAGRVVQTRVALTAGIEAVTDLAYDHAGHLRTEILPDPNAGGGQSRPVITHEYNWVDLETERTDARGKIWLSSYDALNRLVSTTTPLGAVTTTSYVLGTNENRRIVTSPAGVQAVASLDALGRTTSEQVASFAATTYAYDVLGNVTSVTDPAGIRTESTYTNLSELESTTAFAQQGGTPAVTEYTYDTGGRLAQVDGPLSAPDDDRITYGYDLYGRLTSATYQGITLPSSTTKASVSVTYNQAGERIKVSQPLTTSTPMDRYWTYDGAGREVTYRDDLGTTTYNYNLAGWLTVVDDPRATDTYFGYDDLGRRVCRHTAACDASTSGAERFAYDAAGNLTEAISIDLAPTYTMTYDDDGRLATVSRGQTLETTYTYDPGTAQLTEVADPAGTTALTYNAAGQLATLDDPLSTSGVTTYTYDGDPGTNTGRLVSRTDGQANLRWELDYEPETGRIDAQEIKDETTSAVLASFDLSYDLAGNVTSKASAVFSNPSNGTWSYDYDGASRLVQAQGPNATGAATTWDYAYDGGGNRIRVTETTGQVVSDWTTTYDGAGLPTAATEAVGGEAVTYAHDGVGNLTLADSSIAANDVAYAYDAFSRLSCFKAADISCDTGPTRVLTTPDALDRIYQRTYDNSVTDVWYQGIGEVPVRTQTGSGEPTTYAYTASGASLGEKTGSEPLYHLRDTHGDVVGLVSSSGAEAGTSAFDPWGQALATSGTGSWFGYQGDPTDPVSGLVDMMTRWYSPSSGRFTTRDVLFGQADSPMSLNRFPYAQANPVSGTDPTGMMLQCAYCTSQERTELARSYATAMSSVKAPPPPEPAPPIVYRIMSMVQAGMDRDWLLSADVPVSSAPSQDACTGFWGCLAHGADWVWDRTGGPAVHGIDRGAGWVADKMVFWATATVAEHVGRADARPCGAGTCYDNANFLVPWGMDAMTVGTRIFCRDICDERIVAHENIHVEQWRDQGLSFGARYILQATVLGRGADCDNTWEREAYTGSGGTCRYG